MFDCSLWIAATHQGAPSPGSDVGHFVRLSDNPHMSRVAQMQAGGRTPEMDCFPADALSALRDRGRSPSIISIEQAAKTNRANGTDIRDAAVAARTFGLGNGSLVYGQPPAGLWVMNSAWGGLIPPAQAGPYYAASHRWYIPFNTPGPWGPPPEAHMPTQEYNILRSYCDSLRGDVIVVKARLVEVGFYEKLCGRTAEPAAFDGWPNGGLMRHFIDRMDALSWEAYVAEWQTFPEVIAFARTGVPDCPPYTQNHQGAVPVVHPPVPGATP